MIGFTFDYLRLGAIDILFVFYRTPASVTPEFTHTAMPHDPENKQSLSGLRFN